jgi:hypothetical protein
MYLAGAFTAWELNPAEWTQLGRSLVIFAGLFGSLFVLLEGPR